MTPKSWKCEICKQSVSELGAYVKISANRYAHLPCYDLDARERGRALLLEEQARERAEREARERQAQEEREARERQAQEEREARERQAQEEREARERALAERRAEVAERERVNRIEAQRAMPLPPRVDREAEAARAIAEGRSVSLPAPGAELERPKSRFELLDLDDTDV